MSHLNDLIHKLVAVMPPHMVYPSGLVEPIAPKLRGRAFFPGGCGLFDGAEQTIPTRPAMLVGQDFGTTEYWRNLSSDHEPEGGTWAGLKKMLARAGVDPRRCFFTNVLLGVRAGGPIEGPSPGLASPTYVSACVALLRHQISLVQPSVIVSLGVVPTIFLARELGVAPALSSPAPGRVLTWNELDGVVEPFVPSIVCADGTRCAFATSVHPARHWLNAKWRSWRSRSLVGTEAHDAIWREVRRSLSSVV